MEVMAVKKRLLACLLTVAMLVGFIPCPALAADAGDVTYRDYDESSQTWNESATIQAGSYTLVSNGDTTWGDDGHEGWYVLNADTTFRSRISVTGDVHLILMDDCILATGGITVAKGNSLTIYAQSKGTGALVAKSNTEGWAGIGGGESGTGGEVTINGGKVTATGTGGAGIGGSGGNGGAGGKITINGGEVTATSAFGAGIGGGDGGVGGEITINGGTVEATSNSGAGIGSGMYGDGGTIIINGGTVTATSTSTGAGIGGGEGGVGGKITINGGTVEATSSNYGAGIGGGSSGTGGEISITSGTVKATSRTGAGIGSGSYSDGGTISISGGEITATSSGYGAGIGGGESGAGGEITITGGTVEATGSNGGAGIGGGDHGTGGKITISNGKVTATGKGIGAGIGGGINSAGGTINITSGTVTGTSLNAAGIGGGKGGDAGTFTTAPNENAFILASSIQNTSSLTNGVIFQGNDGKVYGGPITLTTDATIPAGKTLVIEAGQTLIIPDGVTLTNNGTIINNGTITGEGTLSGNKLSQSKPGTDEGYTIHYDAETIQADSGYEVSSNTSGDLVSDPIPGQTLYVRKAESNLYQASDWTKFDVPDRPSAPSSLQGEKTSYAGSKDGKITGLIDGTAYQISDNNGNTWKDAVLTETEITDLTADTYWVRVKATGSSFASEAADVEVLDGPVRTVYTLTVNGGSGGGEYAAGASVTITANVPSGKRFTGWTVNQGNVTLANTSTVSFVMPGETVTITANFENIPTPPPIVRYRVTVATDGGGTVSGGGTYRKNTTVTVTAAAYEGYRFVAWTENGRTVSSSEQYRFTILSNRNLVAVFEQEEPTPPEHIHEWAAEWSTDETYHWHECLAENCEIVNDNEKDGYAAHVYDDEWDEACNVCGHIRPVTPPEPEHVHEWDSVWSGDDTHHWHECLAENCEITADSEKDGYAVHVYDDEWDETCNVCGHIRPVTPPEPEHVHEWASAWSMDSSHHWHECLAEDCDIVNDSEKDGYAAHTPSEWIVDIPASSNAAGRRHRECTVCGWVTETESIPATGGDSRPSGGGSSGGGSNSTTYPPVVEQPSTGGSAAEVSPSNPRPGDTVTITPKPDEGYETDTVTVTSRNSKPVKVTARPNGTYAFTQPSGSVTIAVTYSPSSPSSPSKRPGTVLLQMSQGAIGTMTR